MTAVFAEQPVSTTAMGARPLRGEEWGEEGGEGETEGLGGGVKAYPWGV